jgi:hypothetical protein
LPPPALSPERYRHAVELIAITIREAELMAELVIAFLEGSGLLPPAASRGGAPIEFPAEFLLELGAILRIASWDRAGIRQRLDPGLPPADQAYADFVRRLRYEPESFLPGGGPASLLMPVMWATWQQTAWNGRADLGADVVLDPLDDDQARDAVAEFLFAHRHRPKSPQSPRF